jgi:hypothetical protein
MWLTLGLLTWFGLVALVWTLEWQDQGKLTPLNAVFLMVVGPTYVAIAIFIAIALFSGAPSAAASERASKTPSDVPRVLRRWRQRWRGAS